jgi:hypothetical protein
MKKFIKVLFITLTLALVSACTDVASNNRMAEGGNQPPATNKSADKPDNSAARSNAEPATGANIPNEAAPDVVVEELYRTHDNENSPFFQAEDRAKVDKYFTKALAEIIWQDAIGSPDEVGALDFDPLYNAQDTEISEFKLNEPEIKDDKATVVVSFKNFDEPQTIKYLLIKENAVWKIDDIDYGEFTLAKTYKENINEENTK